MERGPAFDLDDHQDNRHAINDYEDQQENQLIIPPPGVPTVASQGTHVPRGDQQEHQIVLLPPPGVPTVASPVTHVPGGDNPNTVVGDNESIDDVETCPQQNVGTYKDGPEKIRRLPIDREEYEFAFNVNVISDWERPVPAVSNSRHVPKSFHAQHKLQQGYLAECYLLQNSWFEDPTCVSEFFRSYSHGTVG
jgi:hypothetical protein